MQETLVSIITPLYNGEAFIAQTIDSVIAQTYTNWEMIIINDGSKDNSENIVLTYCDIDPRIKLFNQPNAGSAAARNNVSCVEKYSCADISCGSRYPLTFAGLPLLRGIVIFL